MIGEKGKINMNYICCESILEFFGDNIYKRCIAICTICNTPLSLFLLQFLKTFHFL